jgi:hypothetical protein
MGQALSSRVASGGNAPANLEERVLNTFTRIEVKPPFVTDPLFVRYRPSPQQLAGVVFRLTQLRGQADLLALADREFDRAVQQVWELVRWIHTDDERTVGDAV